MPRPWPFQKALRTRAILPPARLARDPRCSVRARAAGRHRLRRAPGRACVGRRLRARRGSASPFLLRTVDPPLAAAHGRARARGAAARQAHRARARGRALPRPPPDDRGTLALADAGAAIPTQGRPRRVRLRERHAAAHRGQHEEARVARTSVRGEAALAAFDPGGLEVARVRPRRLRASALQRENHTLKRALTDPRILSAASATPTRTRSCTARGSRPCKLTRAARRRRARAPVRRRRARRSREWTERLRDEVGDGFPEKVTAFRAGDGGARALRAAVPGVRHAGAAHRARREREQLLPALPDRRASCSPTARSRGCSRTTGRARSRSSRRACARADADAAQAAAPGRQLAPAGAARHTAATR